VYKIWGGDWCKDCRALLPDFGAALEAAAVPDERIEESSLDQDKQGPGVDEYDIEYIPTIVVENDEGRGNNAVRRRGGRAACSLARRGNRNRARVGVVPVRSD